MEAGDELGQAIPRRMHRAVRVNDVKRPHALGLAQAGQKLSRPRVLKREGAVLAAIDL